MNLFGETRFLAIKGAGTSEGATKGWDTRGRKGKKTSSPTSKTPGDTLARAKRITFYHGTASEALAGIKKYGLMPGRFAGGDAWAKLHVMDRKEYGEDATVSNMLNRPPSVFLTQDPYEAAKFAELGMELHPKSAPLLLKFEVPEPVAKKFKEDEEDPMAVRYEGGVIKPEWLKSYKIDGAPWTINAAGSSSNVLYAVIHCLGGK
jgi:hypothetical protein